LREFGGGILDGDAPAKGENPAFGSYEVGIGFSGTRTADSGEQGIALPGKRSLRIAASLKLLMRRA
jgi:hypothetical protein